MYKPIKDKPYTTQLSAGLGLIEEIKSLLTLFQPNMTKAELYQLALESGLFPKISSRRLKNIISDGFASRFIKSEVAIYLKQLAPHLSRSEFLQILLIHTALANKELFDFITDIYWQRYASGHDTISNDDAYHFIINAINSNKTLTNWSESTTKRISTNLIGCCIDYGLLTASKSSQKIIKPINIEKSTTLYLAYWLHFSGLGDNAILHNECWQLFGLDPLDVKSQLQNLAKDGWLILQSAGEVVHIGWQFRAMEDVINVITQR